MIEERRQKGEERGEKREERIAGEEKGERRIREGRCFAAEIKMTV